MTRIKIIQISCQKQIEFSFVLYNKGLDSFRSTFHVNKYNINLERNDLNILIEGVIYMTKLYGLYRIMMVFNFTCLLTNSNCVTCMDLSQSIVKCQHYYSSRRCDEDEEPLI